MTADEVLRDVRGYASAGRVTISRHAKIRMVERRVRLPHLVHALANASACAPAETAGRWRVCGPDRDGDELTAVVVLEAGVLVVTVF